MSGIVVPFLSEDGIRWMSEEILCASRASRAALRKFSISDVELMPIITVACLFAGCDLDI